MNKRIWLIGGGVLLGLILFVWGIPWLTGLGGQMKYSAEAAESIVLEQYPGEIVETTAQKDRYFVQLQSDNGRYQLEIDGNSGEIISIVRLERGDGNVFPDSPAGGDEGSDAGDAVNPDRSKNGGDPSGGSSDPAGGSGDPAGSSGGSDGGAGVPNGGSGAPSGGPSDPAGGSGDPSGTPDRKPDSDPNPDPEQPGKPAYISEKEAIKIALKQVPGEVDDVDFYRKNNQVYYLVEIEVDDEREEAVIQVHAITGAVMSITWDDVDED